MGIFDAEVQLFARYRATLQFRDKLMGAIPKDPGIIQGWLRAKAGITQEQELMQVTIRTLRELGADVSADMSYADLVAASEKIAGERQTNGFKRNADGLYLESRVIKSMLKESTNILYAGDRWGRTKKGPRSYLAERVFPAPEHDQISLGRMEPDGVELFIGHTTGPSGPRSNLTYHEYVSKAQLTVEIMAAEDCIEHATWAPLWVLAQEEGLGALRSQGHGRFDIIGWELVQEAKPLGSNAATAKNGRATATA